MTAGFSTAAEKATEEANGFETAAEWAYDSGQTSEPGEVVQEGVQAGDVVVGEIHKMLA